MRMKAALLKAEGQPFVIDEIDLDEPRPNEVIVRVASSGICHTDLATRFIRGAMLRFWVARAEEREEETRHTRRRGWHGFVTRDRCGQRTYSDLQIVARWCNWPLLSNARCHANPVDAHERVHDLFGHALAEGLLVEGRAHVREWQQRDRHRRLARGLRRS